MNNRINTQTFNDLLSHEPNFGIEAIRAIKAFRSAKPWRGSFDERLEKFSTFCQALAAAYGVSVELRFYGEETPRGNGMWVPERGTIVLAGKLSVVTFLFCFGLARGLSRRRSFAWAHECFRRFFPLSYSRCRCAGDLLVRD
jgi:hypothetical protein